MRDRQQKQQSGSHESSGDGAAGPAGGLRSLQSTAGNAAVSELLGAGRRAVGEQPYEIPPDAQGAIDRQRGDGAPLAGALRDDMESLLGADLGDVGLHVGPESDALTSRFGALAFTQGNDVFLRSDHLPTTSGGQATLAHELQHVALGAPQRGAVVRDEAPTSDVDADELMAEFASSLSKPLPQSSFEVHPGVAASRPQAIPTADAPAPTAATPQTFDASVVIDHERYDYQGLTEPELMRNLDHEVQHMGDLLDTYRGWHLALLENREDHKVVGFWSDVLGGVNIPDVDMWNAFGREELWRARAATGQTPDQFEATVQQRWKASQQRNEEIKKDTGNDLSLFGGPIEEQQRVNREAAEESQVRQAVEAVQKAANTLELRRRSVFYYKEGTEKGAVTGVKIIKTTNKVLAATASAGIAGELEGVGLVGRALVTGGANATLNAYAEVATETGEMFYGDRKWGDFDLKEIAKVTVKEAINGFVGALVAGKLTQLINVNVLKYLGPVLEDAGIDLEGEGLNLAATAARDWIVAQLSSPVNTTLGVVMEVAIDGKDPPKDWGEYFDRVLDDLKTNAEMSTVMVGIGKGLEATSGAPPVSSTDIGRPSAPEPAAGGGGGGAGDEGVTTSSTAPDPVDPYARTEQISTPDTGAQRGNQAPGSARTQTYDEVAAENATTQEMAAQDIVGIEPEVVPADEPGTVANAPLSPSNVTAVDSAEATRLLWESTRVGGTGQRFRLIQNQQQSDVDAIWQNEYHQQGAAPDAWIDTDGVLVANASRVRVPIHSQDVAAAAAGGGGGAPPAPPSGGGGGGGGGGGPDDVDAWARTVDMGIPDTGARRGNQAPASARTDTHEAVAAENADTQQTPAQPDPDAPVVAQQPYRTAAGSGPVPVQEPVVEPEPGAGGPRVAKQADWADTELDRVFDDPVEIRREIRAADSSRLSIVDGAEPGNRMAMQWRFVGGRGEMPIAFSDSMGRLWVDVAQMPEAMNYSSLEDLEGPIRPNGPAESDGPPADPDYLPEPADPHSGPEEAPMQMPAYSDVVAQVVQDPADAATLFAAESRANRLVYIVRDESILRDIWQNRFHESGDPPAAWFDDAGVLTVDATQVDIGQATEQLDPDLDPTPR